MKNTNSELYILSRMLGHPDSARDGVAALEATDFTEPRHRIIFQAIQRCLDENIEVDILNVATTMKNSESDDTALEYLQAMSDSAATSGSSIKKYVDDLKACTRLRKINAIKGSIDEMIENKELSPDEIIGEIYAGLSAVADDSSVKTSFTLDEEFYNYRGSGKTFLEFLQQRQEDFANGVCTLEGIPTDFPQLDETIQGFVAGHYNLIGARPACGKTSFCLNLIYKMMEKNIPMTIFSLEMTLDQILAKFACLSTGHSYYNLMKGNLNHEHYLEVVDRASQLLKKDVSWEMRGTLSINQVVNRIRQDVRTRGVKVFYIDYFSRLTGGKRFNSRQEEMQYISTRLAECAKSERVCIICVAQLNREASKGTVREPRESDLGESGQLERDAHNIILLHKPDKEDPYDRPGMIIAKVVKARFGSVKDIRYSFEGSCGKFTEMKPFTKDEQLKGNYIHAQHDEDDAFSAFTP